MTTVQPGDLVGMTSAWTAGHPDRPALPFHIGLTTRHLESALETLGPLLGLSWTPVLSHRVPGLMTPEGPSEWWARRAHSVPGPLHLEVFEGSPGSTWATDDELTVHHLAFWADDLGAEVRRLQDDGWTTELYLAAPDGSPTDFAYLTHPDQLRTELVDRGRQPGYAQLLRTAVSTGRSGSPTGPR